jgi:hypothetical protein
MGGMDPAPAPYLIRIKGHLGATMLSAFKIATPMDTGSAATPIHARLLSTPQSVGPFPDELELPATNRQMMLTVAPLASHFSCWRRSPVARRQLSAWRAMKASDSPSSTKTSRPWTALNQPAGWSRAARPPLLSTRTGCAARAPPIAAPVAASSAANHTPQARSAPRQNREGSLPSGNSKIATANNTRLGPQISSSTSPTGPKGRRRPRR